MLFFLSASPNTVFSNVNILTLKVRDSTVLISFFATSPVLIALWSTGNGRSVVIQEQHRLSEAKNVINDLNVYKTNQALKQIVRQARPLTMDCVTQRYVTLRLHIVFIPKFFDLQNIKF